MEKCRFYIISENKGLPIDWQPYNIYMYAINQDDYLQECAMQMSQISYSVDQHYIVVIKLYINMYHGKLSGQLHMVSAKFIS